MGYSHVTRRSRSQDAQIISFDAAKHSHAQRERDQLRQQASKRMSSHGVASRDKARFAFPEDVSIPRMSTSFESAFRKSDSRRSESSKRQPTADRPSRGGRSRVREQEALPNTRSARPSVKSRGTAIRETPDRTDRSAQRRPVAKKESIIEQARREARRRRAEAEFDRTIGAHEARSGQESGPKAALYSTQMGRIHKKSSRMRNQQEQHPSSVARHGVGSVASVLAGLTARKIVAVPLAIVLVLVLSGVFLYEPTRSYYIALRTAAKTQAEYDQVSAAHEKLQNDVDTLSTTEGAEDTARKDFGMVESGENLVVVSGLKDDSDESTAGAADTNPHGSQADASSIKAPDTWYSGVLDPLFGYQN